MEELLAHFLTPVSIKMSILVRKMVAKEGDIIKCHY